VNGGNCVQSFPFTAFEDELTGQIGAVFPYPWGDKYNEGECYITVSASPLGSAYIQLSISQTSDSDCGAGGVFQYQIYSCSDTGIDVGPAAGSVVREPRSARSPVLELEH
jgi:hypothetical protein